MYIDTAAIAMPAIATDVPMATASAVLFLFSLLSMLILFVFQCFSEFSQRFKAHWIL